MRKYILRFDDLCPTMNWDIWDGVEKLLDEYSVQPLLAVVPDNRDPKLVIDAPNPQFWQRARGWQSKGWIIAQHGYQHVYDTREPGLVPWWPKSEFAGHPYDVQYSKVSEGLRRLTEEGLKPSVWIAPSHSLDSVTLDVVNRLGIQVVSDGVGFRTYRDRLGLVWVPVHPWLPPGLRVQVSTLCIHHNSGTSLDHLERLIRSRSSLLMGVSFDFAALIADPPLKSRGDALFERAYWPTFLVRRHLARIAKAALRGGRKPELDRVSPSD